MRCCTLDGGEMTGEVQQQQQQQQPVAMLSPSPSAITWRLPTSINPCKNNTLIFLVFNRQR